MKLILILTLFISTYSIGASSHAATSVWSGWNIEELASFLQSKQAVLKSCSAALQYNYESDHGPNIKEALRHLHRQYTEAVVSCAKAFYTACTQEQEGKSSTTHSTSLLPRKSLPRLEEKELFKNGKFHPALARLIQAHDIQEHESWNGRLDHLTDHFSAMSFITDGFDDITHICIPLYIIDKSSHRLTQTHISKSDANILLSIKSPLAFNKEALLTAHTGAVFIYAQIAVNFWHRTLCKRLSFIAYETQPHPESPLQEISEDDTNRRQEIEKEVQHLRKIRDASEPPTDALN